MKNLVKLSVLAGSTALVGTMAQASTDYGPAIWHPLCNANWYTSGYGHKFHVVHDMEGYYASTVAWFDNCTMTSASVHYAVNGVKDATSDAPAGEITQLGVRESQYAWHATCWNKHSTGTEHEGFASNPAWYTEAMYQASAGITKHVCEKFAYAKDRNHVVGHGEKSNGAWVTWANANLGINATCNTHTDPGPYWDWSHYMALINGNNASVVSVSVPGTVGLGKSFTATVVMNNNGGTAWTTAGSYRLGSQDPQDNTTWTGSNRVGLQQDPVNAGANATFTFTCTAPSTAGTYAFDWQMVQDGVQWFGAKATANIVVAAINDASVVSISAPSPVLAGQVFSATVTMNNNGNLAWTSAGNYHLGSQSPQDNTTWGFGRVNLQQDPVNAGANATFTFNATAPTTPGTYAFAWKMVQDGVQWYGATASMNITVNANLVSAIVDNSDAGFSVTGTWSTGTSSTDKYGADYRFHSTVASSLPAQWVANLANTGTYNIYAWWPAGANRSSTAPYVVYYNGGNATVPKNQQTAGGAWNLLGTYSLLAGNNTVKLSTWTTTGFNVMADAIKWQQQ